MNTIYCFHTQHTVGRTDGPEVAVAMTWTAGLVGSRQAGCDRRSGEVGSRTGQQWAGQTGQKWPLRRCGQQGWLAAGRPDVAAAAVTFLQATNFVPELVLKRTVCFVC